MVKLRCQDCGNIIEGKKSDVDNSECEKDDCGGSFAILNSDDDEYEPTECDHCKKECVAGEYECDECDEVVCRECIIMELENVTICKKCVDKAYPRKIENKVEYKDRIIEKEVKVFVDKDGTPINSGQDVFGKTEFD